MNAPLTQELVTLASAIAAIAINALWQDALLVLGVWVLLRAWPHLNASTRYTVWSATLVAAVLVPIATTVPFLVAPPPPVSLNTGAAPGTRTPILSTGAVAVRHAEPSVARGAGGGVASETLPRVSPLRFPERFRLTLPLPVAAVIAAAWALLAVLALIRLAIGIIKLEALKRDALPLPVEYRDAMARWTAANKGSRDVRLCVSDDTDVPVAVGLFDSMILIPRVLLDQLSETEVDQISLHELAHLRRADDWTNGFQRVFLALLAWNPAARFVGQQLDLEREVACDDWVLSLTGAVRPYALCLTKMAETSSWPRSPIPAPGVFATRKHISLRIERLLGAGRNVATTLSFGPAAAAVAIVGALAFVIAIVAPSIAAPAAPAAAVPVALAAPSVVAPATAVAQATLAPAAPAKPAASESLPASVHVPAIHVHTPAQTIPATNVDIPARDIPIDLSQAQRAITAAKNNLDRAKMKAAMDAARSASGATAAAGAGAAAAASGAAFGMAIAQTVTKSLKGIGPLTVSQNVNSCMSCDFSGVDWSGRDMHGVTYTGTDLSHAKLHGTNFSGGSFNGVDFTNADLRGASFRNAKLTGVDFTGADLTGVDFTGAKLSGGDFSHTNLSSATARSILASCIGCDFSHSTLAGMDLSNISISSDDFSHADLRNVNFSGTTIVGADFGGARLEGANLNGATLNGVDLGGVDLSHVDLSKTHLIGVDLSDQKHQ